MPETERPVVAPDELETPPVGIPSLSDWLRTQNVVDLADLARDARLSRGSFGRRLRDHP
ncbi:hypothetical protein [Actinomycetospora sp. NBRC 106375]|uniref:hypothetical protein n=1 Tax=Actinomycetospora sp. NBRC 106375 TaxID=3032207 RepID=UPI0025541963|nr:hypothetical protein [Actinomycetospora sp. NBRC 106375]